MVSSTSFRPAGARRSPSGLRAAAAATDGSDRLPRGRLVSVQRAPNRKPYVLAKERGAGRLVVQSGQAMYPFAQLKKPGEYFFWPDLTKYGSLRVRAHLHGKRLGVKFHVRKTPSGVRVTLRERE